MKEYISYLVTRSVIMRHDSGQHPRDTPRFLDIVHLLLPQPSPTPPQENIDREPDPRYHSR